MGGIGKSALKEDAILSRESARRFSLWGLTALAAALITVGGFAFHRFGENGLRLGSQLAWRFALLIYVAAIGLGPLARLSPWERFQRADRVERQLLWGFCASFGVYLASLLVPNTFTPVTPEHQGLTLGMALFIVFGAGLTMVIAYVAVPRPNLGERVRRTLLGVGLGYFWLAYALTSMSRLSDSDAFYKISLILMMAGLVLRSADRLVLGNRRRKGAQVSVRSS